MEHYRGRNPKMPIATVITNKAMAVPNPHKTNNHLILMSFLFSDDVYSPDKKKKAAKLFRPQEEEAKERQTVSWVKRFSLKNWQQGKYQACLETEDRVPVSRPL